MPTQPPFQNLQILPSLSLPSLPNFFSCTQTTLIVVLNPLHTFNVSIILVQTSLTLETPSYSCVRQKSHGVQHVLLEHSQMVYLCSIDCYQLLDWLTTPWTKKLPHALITFSWLLFANTIPCFSPRIELLYKKFLYTPYQWLGTI